MESTPDITFEDFCKVDLRAGTIVSAEEVPKSKKLLKFEVDFGDGIGRRQILAGVKMSAPKNEDGTYNVAAFVGFQAMFVVNIAPREMMGMQSHGMILAALNAEGGIVCAGTHGTLLPNGAKFG
jgi:methionyl-tRNA synthetase